VETLKGNKILFIESNTTGSGVTAVKVSQKLGLCPVLIAETPTRYPDIIETGCEILTCNTNRLESLINAIEGYCTTEELCGCLSTSEYYLEAAAMLASKYGLFGNSLQSVQTCRNKVLTRSILAKHNFLQPRYAVVDNVEQCATTACIVGLPCVVKPPDDSGSNNVVLCRTQQEVLDATIKILQLSRNSRGQDILHSVLIEEYQSEPEYSVEMFTWCGKSYCLGITQKTISGTPYFIESRHVFPALLSKHVENEIILTVEQALRRVGLSIGPSHTEVKWTSEGCSIIEVNARLGGGMIPELIRLVTGVNVMEEYIKCLMGFPPNLDLRYTGYAGIQFFMSNQNGTVNQINGAELASKLPGVKDVKINCSSGTEVRIPRNFSERLGYVIAVGPNYSNVVDLLGNAVNLVEFDIIA
jgi:S-sulfo-L-cysteine synthase (3-phospho-L-serine-dependent)